MVRGVRRPVTTGRGSLGGGWAMAAFPGGTPSAADLDAVVRGPAGRSSQPRPPRRLGQLPGARARRHHRRDARPAGRPDRAAPGRQPAGHAARGRGGPGRRGCCPSCRRPSTPRGWSRASAYLFSLGVTAWQDAIVGAYAGMADTGSTYLRRDRERRPGRRRGRRALVGPRARPRPDPRPGRAPPGAVGRPVPARRASRSCRTACCENFTAAMLVAVPRPARPRHRTTRATPSSTPRSCKEVVVALAAEGFQVHVHAIGDRGVARGARRVRGRAGRRPRRRPAPPHRPPPGGPPRRRAALRRAGRGRQRPGAVGLPRAADGRADDPVPRATSGRPGSTPSATSTAPAPGW